MRNFEVYEHIKGFPNFLDVVNDEITCCAYERCNTEKQVENFIDYINTAIPTDKTGRERNLYIWWYSK